MMIQLKVLFYGYFCSLSTLTLFIMKTTQFFTFLTLWFVTTSYVYAEDLGTHCWQQQPYNQLFCFAVNKVNEKYFSLIGENIIPNEAVYPIDGAGLFDEINGVFRIEFTQNLAESLVFENTAQINQETLSGTWRDDGGNQGNFQYLGTGPLSSEKIQELATRSTKKRKSLSFTP